MSITLNKTHPGEDFHVGALLRGALEFQGVRFYVDKPYTSVPWEYLVAEHEGHARVWIHALSCNGAIHYDIPRAEMWAVAAVVTDDLNTRFVYDGFSDKSARPVEQAAAMAAAVARHFGLPVREYADPFAEEV